jgi:hypothetical protein
VILISVEHGTLCIFMNVIAWHSDISGVVNIVNKSEGKRMQCTPKDSSDDACLIGRISIFFSMLSAGTLGQCAKSNIRTEINV